MRILLTGASGYLGLHVLTELTNAGHRVTASVRAPERLGPFAAHEAVAVRAGDLLAHASFPSVTRGHDALVHTALIWGAPETDLDLADTVAAAKLFDAAGAAGVARAVFISSTAVHRPFVGVMRETDALTPQDVYGATKAAGEAVLWSACGAHGMRGVVLRAGPIVGPPAFDGGAFRSDRRIRAFVERARAGDPLHVPHGGRQFVAATDLARVVRAAVESPDASGTYLAVDHEITTWESIARTAVALTDSDRSITVEPERATEVPLFDDSHLVELMGAPLESAEAMRDHLRLLIAGADDPC